MPKGIYHKLLLGILDAFRVNTVVFEANKAAYIRAAFAFHRNYYYCHSNNSYLACNVAEAFKEVWGGVVISTFSLDRFNYNPCHRVPLLPPLHNHVLRLETNPHTQISLYVEKHHKCWQYFLHTLKEHHVNIYKDRANYIRQM